MTKINFKKRFDEYDKYINELFLQKNPDPDARNGINFLRGFISESLPQTNPKERKYSHILKQIRRALFKKPRLTDVSETIILSTDYRSDEVEISKTTGYPISFLDFKKSCSLINFFYLFKSLFYTLYTLDLIKNIPIIDDKSLLCIYFELFQFYNLYFRIKFKKIKNIITNNTAFYEAAAIILKANRLNLNTVKIDYFINTAHTGDSKKIFAKYYYPLDITHKEFYKAFDFNKDVIFSEDFGMLNVDNLFKYTQIPKIKKKKQIIIYLTSHSFEVDLDNKNINDLINFVNNNNNYILVIKTHPHDKRDYVEILNKNVKVCKKTSGEYFKLARQADFIFCILSSLILQSKHLNDNCFCLRYNKSGNEEIYDLDKCANNYAPYLDMIYSHDELIAFLTKEKLPIPSSYFIENINPNFPNSAKIFKEFMGKI